MRVKENDLHLGVSVIHVVQIFSEIHLPSAVDQEDISQFVNLLKLFEGFVKLRVAADWKHAEVNILKMEELLFKQH